MLYEVITDLAPLEGLARARSGRRLRARARADHGGKCPARLRDRVSRIPLHKESYNFV